MYKHKVVLCSCSIFVDVYLFLKALKHKHKPIQSVAIKNNNGKLDIKLAIIKGHVQKWYEMLFDIFLTVARFKTNTCFERLA